MRSIISFMTICGVILIMSCAEPQNSQPSSSGSTTDFDRTNCNEQAGYDKGLNDGRTGKSRDTKFAYDCRHDLRDQAWAGYSRGYDEGQKIWTRPRNSTVPIKPTN